MRGTPARQELIDGVRRCAEAKMTASQAAAALGVTRNTVIGIANRRGIKFVGQPFGGNAANAARKPKLKIALRQPITETPDEEPSAPKRKPPSRCGWFGCTCRTEPGQMLCDEHQKKPLFGPVVNIA